MKIEINVERRETAGRGASRRLRRENKVPVILYGGGRDPVSLQMSHDAIWVAQQDEAFYSSILNLRLGDDVQPVLLRDIQRHPAQARILHLDFQRVMADELLRVQVPLRFINSEVSPAGKAANVLIMQEVNEVEVACLPGNLPAFIEVDLADLEVDDVRHLSSVQLPEGVEIPALALGPDHDVAIVVAREQKAVVEPVESEDEASEAPAEDEQGEAPSDE